ncbi:MAG: PIN domain-containing protein [Magnetococcus sp. DMHC-1]
MNDKSFVDTNIWIYAHLDQNSDAKGHVAANLVETIPRCVITTQVLSEYYSAMVKHHVEESWIRNSVATMMRHCDVLLISLPVLHKAFDVRSRYGFSIWDSLIIASALQGNCTLLYTEDLQHDQWIEGRLRIVNPFLEFKSGCADIDVDQELL